MNIRKISSAMTLVLAGSLAGCQAKSPVLRQTPTAPVAPAKETVWPPNYELFQRSVTHAWTGARQSYGCFGMAEQVEIDYRGNEAQLTTVLHQSLIKARQDYINKCLSPGVEMDKIKPENAVYAHVNKNSGQMLYGAVIGPTAQVIDSMVMVYWCGKTIHIAVIASDAEKVIRDPEKVNYGTISCNVLSPTVPLIDFRR